MPLLPPAKPLFQPSAGGEVVAECPSCHYAVANTADKFCRRCGLRILMLCSKCSKAVRPADRYCAHCGARRWHFFELWRYGILHRSPVFVIGVTAAVSVAYLGLWALLRHRRHS